MTNPSQLFLLADHVKLSLLERQRAISLNLEPNTQDGEISRSLEALREGIEAIEAEHTRLENANDSAAADLKDQATSLRLQFRSLTSQFYGEESSNANTPAAPDFANTSRKAPPLKHPVPQHPVSKSVRFTDTASGEDDFDPNRAALLQPYRDSPSPPRFDSSNLTNQQIHEHHVQIMREQDDHLDELGESIGRQHQLSIQIGNELEGHIGLFDEVDGDIERHATRLEGARRRLTKIRKKAGDHCSLMTIIGLIIILVILIVILK
jgi:syntaxin 8